MERNNHSLCIIRKNHFPSREVSQAQVAVQALLSLVSPLLSGDVMAADVRAIDAQACQSSSNHHCQPWEAQEGLLLPPCPQPPAQTHAVGDSHHWLLYGTNGRVSRADSDNASSIADGKESKERSRWEELNTSVALL